MSNLQKIETNTSTVFIEDDIVHVIMKEDADVDLEAAKEGIEARRQLQNGQPMFVYCDMSKVWQITSEARSYSNEPEVEAMTRGMALVTGGSFPAVTASNFYIKILRPKMPTKIFKSKDKAIAWLKSLK